MTKVCQICGATFETNRSRQKYCSEVCAVKAKLWRNAQYREAHREEAREYARARYREKAENRARYEREKLQQAADETMKRERYGTWERRNMAAIVCAPCGKYPTCFECGEEDCDWNRY